MSASKPIEPTVITIQNTTSLRKLFKVKYEDTNEPSENDGLIIEVKNAIEGFSKLVRIHSDCLDNTTQILATVLKEKNVSEYDEIDFLAHLDIFQQQDSVIDVRKSLRLNSNLTFHGSIEPDTSIQITINHSKEYFETEWLNLGLKIENFSHCKLPYYLFDLDKNQNHPNIIISARSKFMDYSQLFEILKDRGNVRAIAFNTNNIENTFNEMEIRSFVKNTIPLRVNFCNITPQLCIDDSQSIVSIIEIPFKEDLRTPRNKQFLITGQIEPNSIINLIFRIKTDKITSMSFVSETAPRLKPQTDNFLNN